jgi:hypothetical protein
MNKILAYLTLVFLACQSLAYADWLIIYKTNGVVEAVTSEDPNGKYNSNRLEAIVVDNGIDIGGGPWKWDKQKAELVQASDEDVKLSQRTEHDDKIDALHAAAEKVQTDMLIDNDVREFVARLVELYPKK